MKLKKNKSNKINLNIDNNNNNKFESIESNNKFKINKELSVKRRKVSPISVLVEQGLERITEGNIVHQSTPFEISYNKILSTKHIKQVIQIIEFPSDGLEVGYIEKFKNIISNKLPLEQNQIFDLISVQYCISNKQYMGSKKLKAVEQRTRKILRAEEDRLQVMKNPFLDVEKNDLLKYMAETDKKFKSSIESQASTREELYQQEQYIKYLKKKLESFKVVDKYQQDGGTCIDLYNFIEVVTSTVTLTAMAVNELKQLLSSQGFVFREIFDLEGYQKCFSISSVNPPGKKGFDSVPFLATSNIVAATTEKSGYKPTINPDIYIGNNIDNNYRVDLSLSNSTFNENYLMISKTSKTISLMISILFWLKSNNKYVIIKEAKGKEWTPFVNIFNKSSIITMDSDNPTFINTLVIPDYKKYGFKNPITSYSLSYSITVKLLLSLISNTPNEVQQVICEKIVQQVYINNKVDIHSYESYSYSNTINFSDSIWTALNDVVNDGDIISIYDMSTLAKIKLSLARYFSPNGARRFLFSNQLNLDNILFNNRVLLFDYNIKGISDASGLDNEINCRMLQQHFVERLFCSIRKMRDEYTLVIQEDLDEFLDNIPLIEEMAKSYNNPENTINISTLRSTSVLFKSKNTIIDKFRQTISGYIIGNCDVPIMNDLIENTPLVSFQNTLNKLTTFEGAYRYAFMWFNINKRFEPVVTKHLVSKDYIKILQPIKVR